MTVQRNATVLPPHITRIVAYDRRTDGRHLTLSNRSAGSLRRRTRSTGSETARVGSHLIDGWRD